MSPAVGNFVQDLVEMAKATETLPIVQHENETLKADLNRAQDTIAARETAIISYKQQIDDLHAKVRSLEVERDDASFRVLEAEDTAHSILTQARNAQATLAEVIAKLDPPKPQPEPVKEPEKVEMPEGHQATAVPTDAPQGQSESPPTGQATPIQETPTTTGSTTPQESVSEPKPEPTPHSSANDYDPEPTPKWSYEWYQWNDRRNERARNVG